MALGVNICWEASVSSLSYTIDVVGAGYNWISLAVYVGLLLLGYLGLDTGISALTSSGVGIWEGIAPGQGEAESGIQSNVTFCGINSSSGMLGGIGAGATGACCALTWFRSLSISSSSSVFFFSNRSMLLDLVPSSSSLTFFSKFSMCSFVLCRIFR